MREGNAEHGFTLVELMIVVAIVAVLAVVVVPTFMKETQKGKGKSEVNAMFSELGTKLEQYKLETGTFLDIAECPTAPQPSGANFKTTCMTGSTGWDSLRVQPPSSTMYCSYTVESGSAADTLTPPTGFSNSQGTPSTAEPALASSWWYLVAECDEDGQGGTNATFYKSSVDNKLQVQDEGK